MVSTKGFRCIVNGETKMFKLIDGMDGGTFTVMGILVENAYDRAFVGGEKASDGTQGDVVK